MDRQDGRRLRRILGRALPRLRCFRAVFTDIDLVARARRETEDEDRRSWLCFS